MNLVAIDTKSPLNQAVKRALGFAISTGNPKLKAATSAHMRGTRTIDWVVKYDDMGSCAKYAEELIETILVEMNFQSGVQLMFNRHRSLISELRSEYGYERTDALVRYAIKSGWDVCG